MKIYADQLNIVISHCMEKQREILSNTGIDAANFKDIYPLSPAQEGILFHYLYQKGSAAYIEQFSFQIHGTLNSTVFEASWNELVRRYDILRSIFVHKHTERPMQIVLRDRKIEFKTQNISSLSKEAQSRHIRNFKEQDRSRGFNLGKDMLMRITLFETGQDSYEAVWTHHHILMDGWCLGILIRELFEAYKSLKQNIKPVLHRQFLTAAIFSGLKIKTKMRQLAIGASI
ncbi:MAG: hypothetical protein HC887_07250 [Desulfobacteraceae bacterium]|nr:hypothetical protein [Desulfobacteraceae bacterium]